MPNLDDGRPLACMVVRADSLTKKEEEGMEDREVRLPFAMRVDSISVEAAELMTRLLEDNSQPKPEGREVPTTDLSALKRKAR